MNELSTFPYDSIVTPHHLNPSKYDFDIFNIKNSYIGRLWCSELIPDIETSGKFWKHRIAPLMVTYHYVKFYVSIIIHLEVININVRNFNFPIWFYSNPHPLWTPQNMTLTPVFAPFLLFILFLLSFRGPWTCSRQISGTTGQNLVKLGGVIDICF
jgi:hypothetical protein